MSDHQRNEIDDELLDKLFIDELIKADDATIMRWVRPSEIHTVDREIHKALQAGNIPSTHAQTSRQYYDKIQTYSLPNGRKKWDPGAARLSGGWKLMAATLAGAIVTGGVLAYVHMRVGERGKNEEPPAIVADLRPLRKDPVDPGGREFPSSSKQIYWRLENGSETEPKHVTSHDEQASADGTLEDRILKSLKNAEKENKSVPDQATLPDQAREVRTTIFNPDGSQSVDAGSMPVDHTPAAGRLALKDPLAERLASELEERFVSKKRELEERFASKDPSDGHDGIFVQIAARKNQAAANQTLADLRQKYPSELGDYSPLIRRVDLGNKGVWYRVLIGPLATLAEGKEVCEKFLAKGLKDCMVRKE